MSLLNEDDFLVFTEGGTRTHVLPWSASPNEVSEALCGRSPWPNLWSGTGDQEEYEQARELELCSSCRSVLVHREGRVE